MPASVRAIDCGRSRREKTGLRVLILGGTGTIGAAVVRELTLRGHVVTGLARSDASAAKLSKLGAMPMAGDLARPRSWAEKLPELDAVIHMACDFDTDMGGIDRHLLDILLPALARRAGRTRFIYTGGCWLFGAAGHAIATEETAFDPLPAFAWMVPNLRRVLAAPAIDGIVIHPAMVYTADGGVFRRFASDAAERRAVRVVGSDEIRWPLVHADDLATLYALALERAAPKSSYIGAAIDGLAVGRIARGFAKRFATPDRTPQVMSADEAAAEFGEWARGYARDQRLSGAKARLALGWRPKHLDAEQEIAGPG
jgi:nucleoside-diphosphate-sugar epimerase